MRNLFGIAVGMALLSAHAALADGETARTTVAIVKVSFINIPDSEAAKLRELINQKVDAADGDRKSRHAVEYALEHYKELFTDACLADDRCWTQAAKAIPADLTLSGSLTHAGDGYEATLSLFAGDLGRVLRREQISCPHCSAATFSERVGDTVFDVIKANVKLERGKIFVRSPVAGADIRVDGRPVGKTPIEITETVGRHDVVASAVGHTEEKVTVEVRADARIDVDFLLKAANPIGPVTPPPAKEEGLSPRNLKIVGWTLVGASIAGIIIGAALVGIDGDEIRRVPASNPLMHEQYSTASTGGAIIGIGAALGIASVAPFYFAKKKQSARLKVSWNSVALEGRW